MLLRLVPQCTRDTHSDYTIMTILSQTPKATIRRSNPTGSIVRKAVLSAGCNEGQLPALIPNLKHL